MEHWPETNDVIIFGVHKYIYNCRINSTCSRTSCSVQLSFGSVNVISRCSPFWRKINILADCGSDVCSEGPLGGSLFSATSAKAILEVDSSKLIKMNNITRAYDVEALVVIALAEHVAQVFEVLCFSLMFADLHYPCGYKIRIIVKSR